ncbi:chorismate mutase [Actinomadura xylanilytica]|uniref:chorismate mutase n=1 Tax=Actinomadura xylanilytica TaxID=887459 RepID=UPI00255ADBCD|nr:chorismate mutase [Actinomadura xylanilytica]MDL4770991.1 chorismate mutase [Actinomadura xylanilytica]
MPDPTLDDGALTVPLAPLDDLTTLDAARAAIDDIDAALAVLLERRAAVAGVVQRLKPVGGFAGRDPERERAIVAAMAGRAPALGAGRLARIVDVIIEAGLEAAAEAPAGPAAEPPAGRAPSDA